MFYPKFEEPLPSGKAMETLSTARLGPVFDPVAEAMNLNLRRKAPLGVVASSM
jgi:hypothetical protein